MSQKKYEKLSGEEMTKIGITKDKFTLQGMEKFDLVRKSLVEEIKQKYQKE